MHSLPVLLLYGFCFVLLLGMALFIVAQRPRSPLHRTFGLLALCLLLWQLTLFLEARATNATTQLWLGRANFAAVAVAVFFAWCFVGRVAAAGSKSSPLSRWLPIETGLLAALTLLTPLIDEAEWLEGGHPTTRFGPLFPLYLLHVLGYLGAALTPAFRARRREDVSPAVRGQLTFIGIGMLATGCIALVTNALLPYAFGDFRFCDIGALSTLLFALSVALSIFRHGLFDLRILLRATLVYGLLLSFVLGAYSSAVFLLTQHLSAGSAGKLVHFAVLFLAFSFDPLRRFLEEKADRWLFDRKNEETRGPGKKQGRARNGVFLTYLFPWRRR